MITNDPDDVVVLINKNGAVKVFKFSLWDSISLDDEVFMAESLEPGWFGFYDWLRTKNGDVIGVRLHLEADSVDDLILELLLSLNPQNTVENIYIFFGAEREFDEAISGDTDFGGNMLYRGDRSSLAITFNAPKYRSRLA